MYTLEFGGGGGNRTRSRTEEPPVTPQACESAVAETPTETIPGEARYTIGHVPGKYEHWFIAERNIKRPHKTLAEAEEALARIMATPPCKECGHPIGLPEWWSNGAQLAALRLCQDCFFWTEQIRKGGGLVYRGHHYRDCGRNDSGRGFIGFGGAEWIIKKPSGVIRTNNLWHQGDVPAHFRDRLPDNCTLCYGDGRESTWP